jgi:hypothetical protein
MPSIQELMDNPNLESNVLSPNVQIILRDWKKCEDMLEIKKALAEVEAAGCSSARIYRGFNTGNDSILILVAPFGVDQNEDIGEDLAMCWGISKAAHWDSVNGFWFLVEDVGGVAKWIPFVKYWKNHWLIGVIKNRRNQL